MVLRFVGGILAILSNVGKLENVEVGIKCMTKNS